MSLTASSLTAIDSAIAKGELMVVFADRTVRYRDMDELLQARAFVESQIARTNEQPRQFFGVGSKGLC